MNELKTVKATSYGSNSWNATYPFCHCVTYVTNDPGNQSIHAGSRCVHFVDIVFGVFGTAIMFYREQ